MTTAPFAIDDADVKAEVEAAFAAYEKALVGNDTATLNALFWTDDRVLRFGPAENLYGHAAIAAYRAARDPADLARTLHKTRITTFGRDFAVANTEYVRTKSGRQGRQSQTWARIDGRWLIVAAHVSLLD